MSLHEGEDKFVDVERHDSEHSDKFYVKGRVSPSLDGFDDPNFDPTATLLSEESPYPEVRAAVANTDDPEMDSSTLRAWVLGLIFAILIPGVNHLFHFRSPSIVISPMICLLLTFPAGKAWARYMPRACIFRISLNPGPFTIKEHVVITIMAAVGCESAYATNVIVTQRVFYNQRPNLLYQWLLVMSTQLIGFSFGGICKRILVVPPTMIWPWTLSYAALFNTLHTQDTMGSRSCDGISRIRFFTYVVIGYFIYNFLPSYLFTALSVFSWVCWIVPNNVKINQLFGVTHGLGMGLITFDWGQITAFNGSPLISPWWAAANAGFALIFFYWFLLPILYYCNAWHSAYLPLMSSQVFDNTGGVYKLPWVINADGSFNHQKYKSYSPLFLPASFVMAYGLSFASITAILTHALLYYSRHIWVHAFLLLPDQLDIHAHLMSVYKEVPDWWYLSIFLTTFSFGVIVNEVWDTGLSVWAFFLSLIIAFVYTVPIGVLQATTNTAIGLNVITELIFGYALPHHPVAMMLFKTWGYWSMQQALTFTTNLKLGHYMKIPHRLMFLCQVIATIVSGTVQLGVQTWMLSHIEDLCSPQQKDSFTCPWTDVFSTASIIWGVIGPQRLFSHGQLYYGLVFCFAAGALAPLIQWTLHRKFKLDFLKYLNFAIIFGDLGEIPPATPLNYAPWVITCFVFNYIIRRRNIDWWLKYNCDVLSAGLDAGYLIGTLVIFFALQYPKNGTIGQNTIQKWWGNTVYTNTADYVGVPYKQVPDGETFGPSSW